LIVDGVSFARDARRVRAHLGQDHRFAHTLRVARTAAALAQAHGIDPLPARLAGLFHDLARLYSGERLLRECGERGLAIDAFEQANPVVLHARLGAELAREDFGVTNEAILGAIRKHTVAGATMSPLDAIVYLADGLEPGRDYPERAGFLELAFRDLDAAMVAVIENSLAYLRSRGLAAAPPTLDALAAYRSRENCPA
jgi:predicted HD superfamily hydrolase involved in NAD metabolism